MYFKFALHLGSTSLESLNALMRLETASCTLILLASSSRSVGEMQNSTCGAFNSQISQDLIQN